LGYTFNERVTDKAQREVMRKVNKVITMCVRNRKEKVGRRFQEENDDV
jgi:hypothetical protein